jgi:hypothetical protein
VLMSNFARLAIDFYSLDLGRRSRSAMIPPRNQADICGP